jgi:pilus assembly protein CpaE
VNTSIIILIVILLGLLLLLGVAGLYFISRQRSSPEEKEQEEQPKRSSKKKGEKKPKAKERPPAPPSAKSPPASSPASPPRAVAPRSSGKIRILVVDDNPGTRENVSLLLSFEPDMEVIGQAHNGIQGIQMAIELKPHVVLMDINMPDMDGITATAEMVLKVPYCQVIVISVQSDSVYMRKAMAAGAKDFQPKPFTAEELISAIHRVYKVAQPVYRQLEALDQAKAQQPSATQPSPTSLPMMNQVGGAPIIVVYGPKGGAGTSSIAVNLAVTLQRKHGDVVLMDGDLQFGDVMVHLNVRATRTMSDLVHHEQLDIELLPEVLLAHSSGLKLLLAPPQPEYADALSPEMLSDIVKGLQKLFRLVIIDTSTHLTAKILNLLEAADQVLVITIPEPPSIKSTQLFLELAEQIEIEPERLAVVLNRADFPGGIKVAQIEQGIGVKVAYRVPHDPRLYAATNRGVSVNQHAPDAPSNRAFEHMADEVWDALPEFEFIPPSARTGT